MKLLIRKAKIIDPGSSHHGKIRDLLIHEGKISRIADHIENSGQAEELEVPGLRASQGWLDLRASFHDPGAEHKEDLQTGAAAAAAGGYTAVACLPDTHPVIQSKSEVEYVLSVSRSLAVDMLPLGAISCNLEGKDISEMYDMHRAGAVAFSNANKSLESGTMQRALMYVQGFGGLLCVHCDEKSLSRGGQMHEGYYSTLLGLKGIPAHAESIAVQRDLELLRYTGGKLHVSHISTAESVDLIRKAKKEGYSVTCDTAIHQLAFSDEMLEEYDTNYKVFPPLRNRFHIDALYGGLKDGTIDALISDHSPEDAESKVVEFDYAAFGITGLQTLYPLAVKHLLPVLGEEKTIALISSNPRRILKQEIPAIEEGTTANITLFSPEISWEYNEKSNRSRSRNSPLLGKTLLGKAVGIVHKNKFTGNL
jgi:dihydroorotase